MKLSLLNEDEFEDDDSIYDELDDADEFEEEEQEQPLRSVDIVLDNGTTIHIGELREANGEIVYVVNGEHTVDLDDLIAILLESALTTLSNSISKDYIINDIKSGGRMLSKNETSQLLLNVSKASNNKEVFEILPEPIQRHYMKAYFTDLLQ